VLGSLAAGAGARAVPAVAPPCPRRARLPAAAPRDPPDPAPGQSPRWHKVEPEHESAKTHGSQASADGELKEVTFAEVCCHVRRAAGPLLAPACAAPLSSLRPAVRGPLRARRGLCAA